MLYILYEIFQGFQNCLCFHSSIKTEAVLFFHIYIYMYLYIYLYIYKKLSPKWKNFQEPKVFFFRFNILCENFRKIGPIIKNIPNFVNMIPLSFIVKTDEKKKRTLKGYALISYSHCVLVFYSSFQYTHANFLVTSIFKAVKYIYRYIKFNNFQLQSIVFFLLTILQIILSWGGCEISRNIR